MLIIFNIPITNQYIDSKNNSITNYINKLLKPQYIAEIENEYINIIDTSPLYFNAESNHIVGLVDFCFFPHYINQNNFTTNENKILSIQLDLSIELFDNEKLNYEIH